MVLVPAGPILEKGERIHVLTVIGTRSGTFFVKANSVLE